MPDMMEALALGVLVLAVAVFVPTLIDATDQDTTQSVELVEGEQTDLTDNLAVRADAIANTAAGTNATIRVRSLDTLNDSTKTIDEGNTSVFVVDGANVDVENVATSNDSVIVRSTYDPRFGWNGGAATFFDNIGVILALLALIIVVAVLKSSML